jgi:hypothetical protein
LNVSGTEIDTNGNTSIDGTLAVSSTTTFGTVGSPATVTIHKVPTVGTDGVNKAYADGLIVAPAYISFSRRNSDGVELDLVYHDMSSTPGESGNPYEYVLAGIQTGRTGVYHVIASFTGFGNDGYNFFLRIVKWSGGGWNSKAITYLGERRESATVSAMVQLNANDKIFICCDAGSSGYTTVSAHSC